MKVLRWLPAAAAGIALATAGAGAPPAQADGTTSVSILLQAQYVTEVVVDVALHVTCEGGTGVVDVTVEQEPPETQSPTVGTGESVVVCDGNQHDVAVTVTGGSFSGFDVGKAFATATLVAPSGTDTDARPITIGF
jgi:hypothetical protein